MGGLPRCPKRWVACQQLLLRANAQQGASGMAMVLAKVCGRATAAAMAQAAPQMPTQPIAWSLWMAWKGSSLTLTLGLSSETVSSWCLMIQAPATVLQRVEGCSQNCPPTPHSSRKHNSNHGDSGSGSSNKGRQQGNPVRVHPTVQLHKAVQVQQRSMAAAGALTHTHPPPSPQTSFSSLCGMEMVRGHSKAAARRGM